MGTDFRPRTIQTLTQNVENSIEGIRAMRAGGGMTYALSRQGAYYDDNAGVVESTGIQYDAGTEVLGVDYEIDLLDTVTGHAAAAEGANIEYSVRAATVPSTAAGEGVVYTAVGQTASVDTPRDLNASPATGDGQNLVFDCDPFTPAAYEEAAPYVYVDSVLKTGGGVDYTWDGDQVVFLVAPGNTLPVAIKAMALGTPTITGARPTYAGASVDMPGSSADETVHLVWENTPDEDLTLTTDYTWDAQSYTATLTAAGIDKLATGENYRLEYKHNNDRWELSKDIDTPVGASTPCVLSVEVDGVPKTVTTHYTVEAGVCIVFTPGNIPSVAQEVELLHTWTNDKWLRTGAPTQQPGSSAVGTFVVEVDGTPKTGGGVDYTLTNDDIVFEAGSIPAAAAVVECFSKQSMDQFTMTEAKPADTDYGTPVLVVKIDAAEQTLTTNYTLDVTGLIVTFEAADIPTVAENVIMLWRTKDNTFPIGETVGTGETAKVWVDGTLKTLTTDYTISNGNIVFNSDKTPAEGEDVETTLQTANAVVIAGGEVWFDVQQRNTPVWDSIIPTTGAVVEIM